MASYSRWQGTSVDTYVDIPQLATLALSVLLLHDLEQLAINFEHLSCTDLYSQRIGNGGAGLESWSSRWIHGVDSRTQFVSESTALRSLNHRDIIPRSLGPCSRATHSTDDWPS